MPACPSSPTPHLTSIPLSLYDCQQQAASPRLEHSFLLVCCVLAAQAAPAAAAAAVAAAEAAVAALVAAVAALVAVPAQRAAAPAGAAAVGPLLSLAELDHL